MEQDQQFEMVGTFNNKVQQLSIHFIPYLESIRINTSTGQKLFELYFSDEDIQFKWDEQMEKLGYMSFVILRIKMEEFKILGNHENIQWLFNICKGKFIFLQNSQNTKRTVLEQNESGIIYKLDDKCHNGFEYYDKILFMKQSKSNQCFCIPEEIKVLKLVNQIKCPYLMNIETIQYDGHQFSYCYKKKRLETLRSLIQGTPNMKLSQVLEIIRQLLQVTNYFESIKLVHNRLDLDNIHYSKEENVIQITNFSYSFLEKYQPINYKGQIIGHASPESFSQTQKITTASNIYQVGIIFYIMVFGNNPFGNKQDEIQKQNLMGHFSMPKLNELKWQNQTKIRQNIFEMISLMMSNLPEQRKTSSYYMTSKIFLPFLKQKISKMELKLNLNDNQEDDSINEENKFLNTIYILPTKFK
ncbi:unnamed protein product [Paramecium sonneborni]|uniref:Protein kinase domain-containing protein n=1 Tax=Paramecium sonneborni TaxID=65129 RepID=A0A8S1LH41_9CILI|nr:unnamed protein product [Paramecium sonneborni]